MLVPDKSQKSCFLLWLGCSNKKGIPVIAFCCFPAREPSAFWIPVSVHCSVTPLFVHPVLSPSSPFISSEKHSSFLLLADQGAVLGAVTCMKQAKWSSGSAWRAPAPCWQLLWPGGGSAQPFRLMHVAPLASQRWPGARAEPSELCQVARAASEQQQLWAVLSSLQYLV